MSERESVCVETLKRKANLKKKEKKSQSIVKHNTAHSSVPGGRLHTGSAQAAGATHGEGLAELERGNDLVGSVGNGVASTGGDVRRGVHHGGTGVSQLLDGPVSQLFAAASSNDSSLLGRGLRSDEQVRGPNVKIRKHTEEAQRRPNDVRTHKTAIRTIPR